MTNTQEEESAKEGTSSNDACKDESWDAAHLVDDSNQDPKVHGKYNSDDADETIVSSDGVEFKVHSYRLQAASSVFRSLLPIAQSPAQRDPIILTDLLIEHSWIFESLLDTVYELEVTCLTIIAEREP